MDFFRHRYYRINRVLLMIVGQWPYQTIHVRGGFIAPIIFCGISQLAPQIMAIVKRHDDWEFLSECAIPLLFECGIAAKLICSMLNTQKFLKLLNHIRTDWQVWARDEEVNILHAYAEQGRKRTITYNVMVYSTGIVFITQPIVPKVIDVLLKNGTEPGEFPYPVDYYHLDAQKYYFYIVTLAYVSGSWAFHLTVACDAMFIVYVQHGCGIFAALGGLKERSRSVDASDDKTNTNESIETRHKLQRIGINERSREREETELEKKDIDFENLVSCIDRHNDAIEYAKLIEVTYSWCFLFVVGLNIIGMSMIGFQIVMRTNDAQETAKFIALLVSYMAHLYTESYMSQILMDHSISLRYYIHSGNWYKLSLKAQKVLLLMTMRSTVPCTLTAGKISIMSVETFGLFLKSSLSYFTVLRSR